MAVEQADAQASTAEQECAPGTSVADILRLFSAGATGAIVMTLGGEGPLRTKSLTEQIPRYAPRTIYRYAGKLAELEVVEREEQPGVPSKVVHRLTHPCGSDLYDLLDQFADTSLTRLPSGEVDSRAWASLGFLADLWESGLIQELSCDPRSPTELAHAQHGLTYHQVNRRAGIFKTAGLLQESPGRGRRRRYELSDQARRAMALIAGIGRWRERHVVPDGEVGLTVSEVAMTIRTALPLVRISEHPGKCMRLEVTGGEGAAGESIWAEVRSDGKVHGCAPPSASPDARVRGRPETWLGLILDNRLGRMNRSGDLDLADTCLRHLYTALWARTEVLR